MSNGWWDKKLGPPPAPRTPLPVEHPQQPKPEVYRYQPPQSQSYQEQPPQQAQPEMPPESVTQALQQHVAVIPRKARANLLETGHCPECDSANYFTGAASGHTGKGHCYDCGYPLMQSGSGMASAGGTADAPHLGAARQPQTAPPAMNDAAPGVRTAHELKAF